LSVVKKTQAGNAKGAPGLAFETSNSEKPMEFCSKS
jgi:hypothetical protein